jgi:hypothetical protein
VEAVRGFDPPSPQGNPAV